MEVGNIYWKGCIQHGSRQHLLEVLEKPQEWAPAVFPISLQIYSKEARKWKLVRSETGGECGSSEQYKSKHLPEEV